MIRSLASLALAAALCTAAFSQSLMTKPDVYGDTIVFTAEGDLWLGSIKDGTAKRITSHEGVETWAKFSPDGKTIAFSAAYDQGRDVYVMPVEGGIPKRLTYDPTLAEVQGWSPDGRYVIYRSYRESPPSNERRLWQVPAGGGQSEMLPIPRVEHGNMAPDGKTVAFVPVSAEWMNWFHYRGGAADDVWITDTSQKTFTRLTNDKAVDTTPVWVGNDLFFASQRDGYSNLYSLDPKSKRTKKVTNFSEPLRYPESDGKTIVFQVGYGLGIYDPQTNASKLLSMQLGSDRIHLREKRFIVATSMTGANIGPTGKRVIVEARGQIFTFPAEEGAPVLIENKPGTRAEGAAWSPDGKKIAFVSDRSGERQIWVADANGQGEPTQVTKDLKGVMTEVGWSPDGKWLTTTTIQGDIFLIDAQTGAAKLIANNEYVQSYNSVTALPDFSHDSRLMAYTVIDDAFLNGVYVYDIESEKSHRVSSPMMNSASPAFDPKGRYLAFIATRDFNGSYIGYTSEIGYTRPEKLTIITLQADAPSPFLVKESEEGMPTPPKEEKKDEKPAPITYDLAGASSRLIDVPIPGGNYGNLAWAGSRLLFTSNEDGQPGTKLMAYDVEKKALATLSDSAGGFVLSADGKKLLILRGGNLHIASADAPQISPDSGRVNLGDTKLVVDPMSEWKQVFDESWRTYRDFFYDAGMHGLDWNAIRRKYEPLMERVGDRTDVNRMVGDMVAELNSGHVYVVDPTPAPQRLNFGYLGANLSPVPGQSAVKIERILRGDDFELETASPLAMPGLGVKEGEYILAINGEPVRSDEDFQALLVGRANQVVSLEVNSSPSREGSRLVRVKPISSESRLRYLDWVRTRREYVQERAGDSIGYLHVPNMGNVGLYEFVKGYYPSLEKDGIIYDIRENTGGWISSLLLKSIGTKNLVWWKPRSGKDWARESGWAPMGHGVALASEGNFSDGELFLETWRRMGLGPIIGVRTSGAEVGSGGGWALIDGGSIYPPNYGTYADGKWVIEGEGVNPDIWVDQDMAAVLAGRDPQLDKAIEVLKERIRKNPIKRPVAPPGPKRTGPNG